MKPANETLHLVLEWLADHGVNENQLTYSRAKDWIKATLPIDSIEHLLDTKYSVYAHQDGSHLVRTSQWSLPLHLHPHIDTVQPTNSFFRPQVKTSTLKKVPIDDGVQYEAGTFGADTVDQTCNITAVTPQCLRTLYGGYHACATTTR